MSGEVANLNTLAELLAAFEQVDDGILELSEAELDELKGKLELKTDSYYHVISRLTAEADRLKSEIDRLATAKKRAEKAIGRVKDLMLYAMKANGFEKLPGEFYTAQIKRSESVVMEREPTPEDFGQLDEYISMKLSWDKREIKAKLETDEALKGLATIKVTESPVFKPRKD